VLDEPLLPEEGGERLTHYERHYVVAALDPDDAIEVVRADVRAERATLLDAEAPIEKRVADYPRNIVQRFLDGRARGVQWKSGRVFFPAM
jgi:hypothetical protein